MSSTFFCKTIMLNHTFAPTTYCPLSCRACRICFATIVPKSYWPSGCQPRNHHACQRHLCKTYHFWKRSSFKPNKQNLCYFERLNYSRFLLSRFTIDYLFSPSLSYFHAPRFPFPSLCLYSVFYLPKFSALSLRFHSPHHSPFSMAYARYVSRRSLSLPLP